MKNFASNLSLMPLALAAALLVAPELHAQSAGCVGDIVTCGAQATTQPSNSYGQTGYPTQTTTPQTGYGTSSYGSTGYGSTGYGASGTSGYGSSGYGSTNSYGSSSGLGTSGSPAVQGAPASSLGQRGGAYGSSGGYGATGAGGYGQANPYGGAQPQIGSVPAAAGGPCTARVSEDRSAIALADVAAGADRSVVALGQDRVQQLFKSPDGAWAVAVFKVRGQAQYGALLFDLAGCAQSAAVDLTNAADSAQFSATDVALTLKGGSSQTLALKPAEH